MHSRVSGAVEPPYSAPAVEFFGKHAHRAALRKRDRPRTEWSLLPEYLRVNRSPAPSLNAEAKPPRPAGRSGPRVTEERVS